MAKIPMKMFKSGLFISVVTLMLVFSQVSAQPFLTIIDQSSNLPIQSCRLVYNDSATAYTSASDGRLFYKSPSKGVNRVSFFAIGFRIKTVDAASLNGMDTVTLLPLSFELRSVSVTDSIHHLLNISPGSVALNAEEIMKLPTVFSEPDLLKAVQLLPGVTQVMENHVGLYIRGGKAENSQILVDGAPIFNPSHSVGFFSTLHPASVKQAVLHTDGISSEYGGAASAFLDVQLKEGNFKKFQGSASIGLISSYLDLQGPLSKGEVPISFQFVGRTSYIDRFVRLFSDGDPAFNTGFSDYSVKLSSKPSRNSKLTGAYYHSYDHYKFENASFLQFGELSQWKNDALSINYSHSSAKGWLDKISTTFSNYSLKNEFNTTSDHTSGLTRLGFTWKRQFFEKKLIDRFGVEVVQNAVNPGLFTTVDSNASGLQAFEIPKQSYCRFSPFISLHQNLGRAWKLKFHLRTSGYISNLTSYFQPEPRLSLSKIAKRGIFSMSYDRLAQFLHLYSVNVAMMPSDVWLSSTPDLKPVISNSITFSHAIETFASTYSYKSSLFFRQFDNVVDLRGGSPAFPHPNFNSFLEVGNTQSYGFEMLFQKKKGAFTGWLSYTYSRVFHNIPNILEEGSRYRANYDKPHNLNVVLRKSFKRWELSGVFVLQSGRPVTVPLYHIGIITIYSERNEERLPVYHRADLSIIHYQKRRKHFQGTWSLSIYNVYNKRNVFSLQFNPVSGNVDYITLFPILPTLSYKAQLF